MRRMNIAIAPLISREGDRIGRLIIFDDITDRAELERRLVQADKLSSIGLLAAGVAHEVNTPLAVISTYAQMLAKQISGDAQKAPLLEKIARQTFRASEIVNSLLNFSRTSPTEFVPLDLNKIVRETLTLVEHQFAKAGIEVELALDETLPRIKGNPGKLQQVFLNLFLNARDAMESGGALAVTRPRGAATALVRVTVADSGAGIAPENLARIFDPFFTTKGARKGHRPGALGQLRDRARARRRNRSRKRAGRGHALRALVPGSRRAQKRRAGAPLKLHRHAPMSQPSRAVAIAVRVCSSRFPHRLCSGDARGAV